ncbi:hypothetical protein ACP70R_002890 [Stipagrostis hirtigluma subsp. patula]
MASIRWALLLHILLATCSTHHADAVNLTHLPVPLCHPDQAKALLQLKKSFSFSESTTTLPSWRDGTDCCLWEGVGCDASSGHVTVLDLNGRGLSSDGLDPAVFSLTSLRHLDLSMNNFHRGQYILSDGHSIPATGFERMAFLTHLNLSSSGFYGPIPIGISKLVNLISLDFSNLLFIGYDYSNIITASNSYSPNFLWASNFDTLVANLSSLRELYLDGVDLSSSGNKWCMSLATSVPHLQVLSLAECGLSGPIHKSLSRLHSLVTINLKYNDITPGPFPEFLMDFLNLTVLQLSDISLEGPFPMRPFQSKNLRVLDLSYNKNLSGHLPKFSNASFLEILRLDSTSFSYPRSLSSSNFKSLKELGLDGNLLSVDFLSSFGTLGSLRQLDLSLNSAGELGPIFSWIGQHENLRSLTLFECDFSVTTPSTVSYFKALRSLTMDECKLPRSILSAIGNLMELQTLIMDSCTTYGSMPSSVGNITNLRNMYVFDCGFSGPMPATIGNLTNLKTLYIVDQFSGTIPYAIGKLKKLTWLFLSGSFFGRIPSSFVNLTQLTKLDLSGNSLTGEMMPSNLMLSTTIAGEIPSSIFTLPVLYDLDLSWNKLSGPIREFEAPLQLQFIRLAGNELSGPIPEAFFHLASLKYLDVRSNNLIGWVSLNSFWRLRDLESLILSDNKLCVIDVEGDSHITTYQARPIHIGLASCNITRFPRSLMLMEWISYLDLSHNKIEGDIPKWVWETWSASLVGLDLSHNMFTGLQLTSDVLPLANSLSFLDLSFNRLQGQIPMPMSSAEFLDYSGNRFSSFPPNFTLYLTYTMNLNVSNNKINGHIPMSICNSSLRVLDLSHNNFSGLIPSCLIENGWLEVLNLRENNIEGMSLPSNITTRCSLQLIDLYANKIEGKLPRGLSNCPDLEVLNFGSNQIADTFPSWLRGLPKLTVIVLRSNRFYGTIADTVGGIKSEKFFPSLHILDLASNSFSGNLKPQWLKLLKSMMKFNSTRNTRDFLYFDEQFELYQDPIQIMYKGSYMPFEEILTTLTVIDISNNRFEGTIPKSIGRVKSLHILNMSHNAFTGEIPAQFRGMTDLEALDLSCNQLSGEIPEELTDLTFLSVLNLSNNHLVGKIPQAHQFSTFGSSSFEGNAGLCGPPLSKLPCGDSPYTPSVPNVHKSDHHVDVVLFLFVGVGYGVGFAAAILVNWCRIGRWLSQLQELRELDHCWKVLIAAVHSNYVDCTRWLGDFIISKSVDNEIVLWEPKTKEQSPGEGSIDILQKYPVPECDIWFIKFSCDFHFNQLAIGNREGKIYVWEVQSSPPVLIARLTNQQCKSPIRQTAVSFDGSTILGAGEDGTIWRWDEVDHPSGKN